MNFPLFVAKRYLLSKKTTNIINVISIISLVGVTFGTMAFIIVLSVFNGIEKLVVSMFNSFDPDLRIELKEGKYFATDSLVFDKLREHNSVAFISYCIEEGCMVEYDNQQMVATVKAVDSNYTNVCNVESTIISGIFRLYNYSVPAAVLGLGIASHLGASTNMDLPLKIWVPSLKSGLSLDPKTAFVNGFVSLRGIFSVQQEYDNKYVIVPIEFVQQTLRYGNVANVVEVKLVNGANVYKVQKQIKSILGDGFEVKNRFEQKELAYKIMRTEKWAIVFILSLILLVSSFNIVGTMVMMIIEKNRDIDVLQALGADLGTIKKIFLLNGWLISAIGAVIGLVLGLAISLGQQYFGWLEFPSEGTFVQNAYPVEVQWQNVIFVFAVVVSIGYIIARFPVRYITQRILKF